MTFTRLSCNIIIIIIIIIIVIIIIIIIILNIYIYPFPTWQGVRERRNEEKKLFLSTPNTISVKTIEKLSRDLKNNF